ncbi:hypothetical protein DO72_5465 [Burkholderia pseudomallei]|nr:hypothetical protein DO72_5465 [Burkholderia pseudomallei]
MAIGVRGHRRRCRRASAWPAASGRGHVVARGGPAASHPI